MIFRNLSTKYTPKVYNFLPKQSLQSFLRYNFSTTLQGETELLREIKSEKQQFEELKDKKEDYEEILNQLKNLTSKDEDLARISNDLLNELREIQIQSFELDSVKELIDQLEYDDLIYFAISYYVGSISCPKNEQISTQFINKAAEKASTLEQKNLIKFYKLYMERLGAIQTGNIQSFEKLSQKFAEMGKQDDAPGICNLVLAKELYKVGLNMIENKQKDTREQMMIEAYNQFKLAADKNIEASYYYIGELWEYGEGVGSVNLKNAVEWYQKSADTNYPRAYFKLAQFAKKNLIITQSPHLYYEYTKKAAELGQVEAQHNLAVMYYEGVQVSKENKTKVKNELRAFSWFVKASSNGYPESKFNAAFMMTRGTDCGTIKKNKEVATLYYQQLKDENEHLNLQMLWKEINKMED